MKRGGCEETGRDSMGGEEGIESRRQADLDDGRREEVEACSSNTKRQYSCIPAIIAVA